MKSRVIGGEFELTGLPESAQGQNPYYGYASGRAALYKILMSIKLTTFKVWLPDWLCESMIDAVKRTGLDYGFYALDTGLRMDVPRFVASQRPVSEHDVIVLVNYFGLVDIERTIDELRVMKVESVIIEDDVQALFSFLDDAPHAADYRFTSLRKTIAAPDGGLVRTSRHMPLVKKVNTFAPYKMEGALLKGRAKDSSQDDVYLQLFRKGEDLIESNYDSLMSNVAYDVWVQTDLARVAEQRRANAGYLIKELSDLGIHPMLLVEGNQVPLFVPILIDNRDDVRRELRRNAIFCPVHWPLREDMGSLPMGRMMAEKELSLVVDQRYNLEDMGSIVQVLKDSICK